MRTHWQGVYAARSPTEVSWYLPEPVRSLAWIQEVAPDPEAAILDVGAGRADASTGAGGAG